MGNIVTNVYAEEVDFGHKELQEFADIFKDMSEMNNIISEQLYNSKVEYTTMQQLLKCLEGVKKELDKAKYLCIKSKLQTICTG